MECVAAFRWDRIRSKDRAMAFANSSLLLIGALSIAIPVFLHLLMRPRPKPYTFPAIRFIQQVQKTNQRRMRLRHWILLFLRCLLIGLICLALARPSTTSPSFGPWITLAGLITSGLVVAWLLIITLFWQQPVNRTLVVVLAAILLVHLFSGAYLGYRIWKSDSKHLLGDQQAPVAAVFVIDTTPTMSYQFENQSRLDQAKEIAHWLIDRLPLSSEVAIVATDSSGMFFSEDIRAAEKRLDTLEIEWSAQPVAERLNEAIDWVSDAEIQRKEVYVISDMTSNAWRSRKASIEEKLQNAADISTYIIDVGIENPVNFSLGALKLNSSRLSSKSELEIQTELFRVGDGGQRNLQLMIEKPDLSKPYRRDGKTVVPDQYIVRNLSAIVATDSSTSVTFHISELPEGVHHGWVQVEGADPLAVDNKRYFTIQVRKNWQVLIVSPKGVSPKNVSEVIAPSSFRETGEALYDYKLIDQDNLGREELQDYDAVFLLDPQRINESTWNDLQTFAAGGGGLAIALGSNAANGQEIDDSFTTESALEVLPGRLTRVFRAPEGGVYLSPSSFSHPILQEFQPIASSIPWNRFPIHLYWGVDPESISRQQASSVILSHGNGTPAIVERRVGSGTVIVWTTPVTDPVRPVDRARWNDLTIGECWPYVMLIEKIAVYLVENQSETLNYTVGQIATLDNDPEKYPDSYILFSPRGDEPSRVLADDDRLTYTFTNLPGSFRLKGQFDGPIVRGFSVNLPADATDVQRVDPEQLDKYLGKNNYQLANQREQIVRQQSAMRIGTEFYPILMLLLAGIFAAEHLMANRFYR